MKNMKFTFIGGDMRLAAAHLYIKKMGFDSATFLLEKADGLSPDEKCIVFPASDVYVLPLPVTIDGIHINSPLSDLTLSFEEFFSLIDQRALIFGGLFPDEIKLMAKNKNISLLDYYNFEEFQIRNSIPTAEGALEIALREMPITLYGTKSLVLGYGRISKVLSPMLKAMGSEVFLSSRKKESMLWSEISGFNSINTSSISESLGDFDLIINTVPSLLLKGDLLKKLKPDCLIIDLASRPGGVDIKSASELGIRVIWALGLPGKCAPVSAGHIIGNTILSMLSYD